MISVTRKPRVIPWVRPLWICLRPRPQVTTVWNTDMWVEHDYGIGTPKSCKNWWVFCLKVYRSMTDDRLMFYVRIKISSLKVLVFVVPMAIVKKVISFMPYMYLFLRKKPHIFMVTYVYIMESSFFMGDNVCGFCGLPLLTNNVY